MRAITITDPQGKAEFFDVKIEGIYPFTITLLELITIRNMATDRIIACQTQVAADVNFRLPPDLPPEQAKLCFD